MPRSLARARLLNPAHARESLGRQNIDRCYVWPVCQSINLFLLTDQLQHLINCLWVGTALWRVKSNARNITRPVYALRGGISNHAKFLPQLFICTSWESIHFRYSFLNPGLPRVATPPSSTGMRRHLAASLLQRWDTMIGLIDWK